MHLHADVAPSWHPRAIDRAPLLFILLSFFFLSMLTVYFFIRLIRTVFNYIQLLENAIEPLPVR